MSDLAELPEGGDPSTWISWTTSQQSLASDPARSAWVSANAGSGKTHVLTQRVIRLLLSGSRPSSILCLTYTKAAASEMSNRVFERLAEWATLPDTDLKIRLQQIEGSEPDSFKLADARRLFAKALETPGGLKIQTIHAFCEALLHQFPLEANVAGHFSVLDDRAATTLLADARRLLLTATSAEDDAGLAEAFAHVLDLADEFGLEALLGDIVSNRHAIRHFLEVVERGPGLEAVLRARFGLQRDDTETSIAGNVWPLPGLQGLTLDLYLSLADQKGGAKVLEVAYGLRLAVKEPDPFRRLELLEKIFLTAAGSPKADSSLLAKAMKDAAPELSDAVAAARLHLVESRDRLRIMRMVRATAAALALAQRMNNDYEDLKRQRSQLDFEDLIARTAELLTKSGVGPWVHYKLDQGIDHILVDEAQDTSPVQWTVIQSLAEDFFSGTSARESRRTIFAVGDEKQSIYSFQGARPQRFAEENEQTAARVRTSGQLFSPVRLPLSFRSTADVLAAVDHVFSTEENAKGLSARNEAVVHLSSRIGHPGAVELWEMIAPDVVEKEEDWTAPFDATPENAPPAVLARRIAQTIEAMIGRQTIIEKGLERAIRAGDILILVRKRDAFVNALTRALKRRNNIPVAGADRLKLTSHIAVQDLLAFGRFMLLPEDDLSLAAILKSPMFDFTEQDIFDIAAMRPEGQSVWQHFRHLADEGAEKIEAAATQLKAFIALSQNLSVHDFFARVLGVHGGRRRFLARLGSEVSDILDEFLNFALNYETTGLPGLQAFVSTLELEAPEVKREQDKGRNEVRVMTVHAAKGLEAPVVFLVDGGSKAFTHTHLPKFRMLPPLDAGLPVPVWIPTSSLANSLSVSDAARIQMLAEEEYRRLLYVAMTRAADRLIVCGYRGKRDNTDTWHAMIARSLGTHEQNCSSTTFSGPDGDWNGLLWRLPGDLRRFEPSPSKQDSDVSDTLSPLPLSLSRPLPQQASLPRPLSPSGAGIIIDDEADDLMVDSPLFGNKSSPDRSLQRGRLIHRMLQMLPDLPEGERQGAATRYAERSARFWPKPERDSLVASVMAVMAHPGLAPVFSLQSQAEVSIMGTLTLNGRDFSISGRIDRLAVDHDRVILLDYKTNRVPPHALEAVSFSHRAQLAIYREILKPLYPGKQFECVLVYTENAGLLTIPDPMLSEALAELVTK